MPDAKKPSAAAKPKPKPKAKSIAKKSPAKKAPAKKAGRGARVVIDERHGPADMKSAARTIMSGSSSSCTLVLVHSPGCGWCERLRPDWDAAADQLVGRQANALEIVASKMPDLRSLSHESSSPVSQLVRLLDASDYQGGVPHIALFVPTPSGAPRVVPYSGNREAADMVRFAIGGRGR